MTGSVHMYMGGTAETSLFQPEFAVMDCPYLFRDYDHLMKAAKSDIFKEFSKKLEQNRGVKILTGEIYYGTRHLTTRSKPIKEPKDLNGMLIRAPDQPIYLEAVRAMGATPTPVAFSDLYMALKQGVVDGQENPIPTIYTYKYYEAQKYLMLTGHMIRVNVIGASASWYNKLPADLKAIVDKGIGEAVKLNNDMYVMTYEDITQAKLTEQQLLQAQKMESIGRLAGGIAHDFNNMLTVIYGHTQLGLLNLESNNPLYHRFEEIQKAAKRSSELTKNLLTFARKQPMQPKVLDVNMVVEDMLKMLKRLIGENIELIWKPRTDLWHVNLDPSQLNQVILNLVINAKDAISYKGTITIETDNITLDETYCLHHIGFTSGDYVILCISDNGAGMDKETLEHIFEPFFTTKPQGVGTGLGLSTVYGIVKQNNGFINVYSELNKGSSFKIYFPRAIEDKETAKTDTKKQILKGREETILLVEDEEDILELCKTMLGELGYKVISARSPKEAIDKAQTFKGKIHLLLTDVIMPEMDGKELANQIKNIIPSIKCLFMSGYTSNAIIHNSILDEGLNYIQKPFTLNDLALKIRQALERRDDVSI